MIDISMPRDLRQRRKSAGYAAICVVGFDADPGVLRIGTAENIEAHLPQLQPGTWHPLRFTRVVWTPGLTAARTIATGVEKQLCGRELGQHWFRAEAELLDRCIADQAERIRSQLWSHAQLIVRLRAQSNREADNFARGII